MVSITKNRVSTCTTFVLFCLFAVVAQLRPQQTQSRSANGASETAPQSPYEQARLMTVAVVTRTFPIHRNLGSAVWLGDSGYLATCEHVVRDVGSPLAVSIAYDPFVNNSRKIVVANAATLVKVELVASDRDTDVAILRASEKPSRVYGQPIIAGITSDTPQSPVAAQGAVLNTSYPRRGESLFLSAYPLGGHLLIFQTGVAAGLSFANSSATPSALRIILSVVSNPGDSGGPILDSEGKVVGLLEASLTVAMRDKDGKEGLCLLRRLDSASQEPSSANPTFETTPCMENTGLSVAVPAGSIVDLAKKNNIIFQ